MTDEQIRELVAGAIARVGAAKAAQNGHGGPTAVQVILTYWREVYDLTFRRGTAVYSTAKGREIKDTELLRGAPTPLIDKLAACYEAPRNKEGEPVRSRLPALFKTWAPTAWQDLLAQLPEEAASEEVPEKARESFRALVTRALLTVVALQYRHGDEPDVQRRPLIDWARAFADPKRWGDVRGLRLWSRLVNGQLRVRLRVEVFGQVHFAELARLTPSEFTGLCEQYGVGTGCKIGRDRKQTRVVELAPDFLDEVQAVPSPEDGGHGGQDGQPQAGVGAHVSTSVPSPASPMPPPLTHAGGGVTQTGPPQTGPEAEEGGKGETEESSAEQPSADSRGDAWDGPGLEEVREHSGSAKLILHNAVFGRQEIPVSYFRVGKVQPRAQHKAVVDVVFIQTGKRKRSCTEIEPTNYRYLTVEIEGRTVYDSRKDVPCDMDEWAKTAAEQKRIREGAFDGQQATPPGAGPAPV